MDNQSGPVVSLANPASVTILIIEKEVLVRTFIAELLREEGYTCIEAVQGTEALDVLRSHMRVDVVLTNMRMSGPLDGFQLAWRVRAEFPFIKILMVSGETPEPSVLEVLDGFILKPFRPERLVREVRTLIAARRDSVPK